MRERTPWHLKVLAKLVLSRLPVPHHVWRRLGIFRQGGMGQAEYALRIFQRCCKPLFEGGSLIGATILELGPGDSVATGLLAHCFGAKETVLVDVFPYATRDMAVYRRLITDWMRSGLPVGELPACDSFASLCEAAHISYRPTGLCALQAIPSSSIDFAFSNAVLEHVSRDDVPGTLVEIRRILKEDARSYHQVDLKDHLSGALNNLRFPDRLWESTLFARAGFYTNRISYREFLSLFAAAGFRVQITDIWRWETIPTPVTKMRSRFRSRGAEDLRVSGFDVVLKPRRFTHNNCVGSDQCPV